MKPPTDGEMVSHHLIEELDVPAESVLEFFCMVARFEYALKQLGYLREGFDWPNPDWYEFAEVHVDDFDFSHNQGLRDAVKYLVDYPPRRQVVTVRGHLGWEDRVQPADLSDEEWAIWSVKQVRNNLFHGDKYPIDPDDDPGRARQLIHGSLEVLHEVGRVDEISPFFEVWAHVDAE